MLIPGGKAHVVSVGAAQPAVASDSPLALRFATGERLNHQPLGSSSERRSS